MSSDDRISEPLRSDGDDDGVLDGGDGGHCGARLVWELRCVGSD